MNFALIAITVGSQPVSYRHSLKPTRQLVTVMGLAGSTVTTANEDDIALSLDGDDLFINMSKVISTDIAALNGIIHVIDTVLLPPAEMDEQAQLSIVDTAIAAGSFNTLVAALEATGLDGAIGHSGDLYTVFAPTDAAFAALGLDTITTLLANPDTLRNILLYHVIPGTVINAESAIGLVGTSIEAGNGDRFELRVDGDSLFINDSKIIATDIRGVNGIIHVLDAVLIPPAE